MGFAWVQRIAAGVVALVSAGLTLGFGDRLATLEGAWRYVGLGAGAVGLFTIFVAALRLGSWWRYRKVLGRWIYASWSYDAPHQRSFATMRFVITDGGQLEYRVLLYGSLEDLEAALRGEPVDSTGDATSITCRYEDALDRVHLIYDVTFRNRDVTDRRGMLRIKVGERGVLDGEWVSATTGALNEGLWRAARPKRFADLLKRIEASTEHDAERFKAHTPHRA